MDMLVSKLVILIAAVVAVAPLIEYFIRWPISFVTETPVSDKFLTDKFNFEALSGNYVHVKDRWWQFVLVGFLTAILCMVIIPTEEAFGTAAMLNALMWIGSGVASLYGARYICRLGKKLSSIKQALDTHKSDPNAHK